MSTLSRWCGLLGEGNRGGGKQWRDCGGRAERDAPHSAGEQELTDFDWESGFEAFVGTPQQQQDGRKVAAVWQFYVPSQNSIAKEIEITERLFS